MPVFVLVPHGTLDKVENDEDGAESRENQSEKKNSQRTTGTERESERDRDEASTAKKRAKKINKYKRGDFNNVVIRRRRIVA